MAFQLEWEEDRTEKLKCESGGSKGRIFPLQHKPVMFTDEGFTLGPTGAESSKHHDWWMGMA